MTGAQIIAGGSFDDYIRSGENVAAAITIYGDNNTSTPLDEDDLSFNINDGNDIIDVENNNMLVKVYG